MFMKNKVKIKRIIDLIMLLLMPLLMAYSLIGEMFHEIAGTVLFVLFIVHHIMNRRWYGSIKKGRYTPLRVVTMVIDILLIVIMLMLPVSGILMSRYVFKFLPSAGNISLIRTVHLLAAFWGFVLLSLHAGMHVKAMLNAVKKPVIVRWIRIAGLIVGIYGIYAFYKRQLGTYMFMRSHFIMLPFDEPVIFYLLDYFAIMVMFMTVSYIFTCIMQKRDK